MHVFDSCSAAAGLDLRVLLNGEGALAADTGEAEPDRGSGLRSGPRLQSILVTHHVDITPSIAFGHWKNKIK